MVADLFDIVRVPFPFTDRLAVKKRPALVLSTRGFNASAGHTVFAMITKRSLSAWPSDCNVEEWQQAGLKFPSWIRLKLFTLENALIVDRLGILQPVDIAGFRASAKPVLWQSH